MAWIDYGKNFNFRAPDIGGERRLDLQFAKKGRSYSGALNGNTSLSLGEMPLFSLTQEVAMQSSFRSRLSRCIKGAVGTLLIAFGCSGALAQTFSQATLQGSVQSWVAQALEAGKGTADSTLRLEVEVGAIDTRLKLAPCTRTEVFLPPGTKLWGRSRVGVRCLEGPSRWNVTLPVTVNAWGKAWVVKGQVVAGSMISISDVVEAEVNWSEDSAGVLVEPSLWLGFVATRPLNTGQTLRQGMVRPAQVFQAGSQVRVVAQGPGFQVSSDGQALSAGIVGQSARVRLDNGRVANGIVLDVRTVKIEL